MVGTATRAGQVWHYLDDGLYGSYSPRPLAPVTLARPTCDSVDVIARDYPMPPLAVGDIVVSPLMGAYTAADVLALQRHPRDAGRGVEALTFLQRER